MRWLTIAASRTAPLYRARRMEGAAGTLVVMLGIAFVAPVLSMASRRVRLPALVFEIVLGIVVGPEVLGWVRISRPVDLLAQIGLATLIFLAGFELDLQRVKGAPIALAIKGWTCSVVLGLVVALGLVATNVIQTELYVGLALTTTALGTLLPIVRDAGLLPTRFGTHVLAIGSVGEFAPIVAVALVLGGTGPAKSAFALIAFAVLAVVGLVAATRVEGGRLQRFLSGSLRSSGQLYVRLAMLLIAALTFAAGELGLDFLLGAFTAGVLFRLMITSGVEAEEVEVIEAKIEAVSFGYLVPIFFVATGVRYDLESLVSSPTALLKVPLFMVLFLVVRGVPMFLYRRELPDARERLGLAWLSATALPLVVAITTIGVEAGQMRSSTAAALVGAGMLSVVIFPLVGMWLIPDVGAPPEDPGPGSLDPTGLTSDVD